MNEAVDRLLMDQAARYPRAEAQDFVKALYQCTFGCGHFVAEGGDGLGRLIDEERNFARAVRESEPPFVEPLGPRFCRTHLSGLSESGLSAETLFRLFVLSSRMPANDMAHFESALVRLEELVAEGALPLDREKARQFLSGYRRAGCPATHHSEAFRRAYSPAYRVIAAEFGRMIPLFSGIDGLPAGKETVLVAIEGGSASGKTSLAALLEKIYDCNVFHMDDFFLQKHQRTPERYAEPGGNVDRERFRAEVLDPLLRGGAFRYRAFDCSRMELGESVAVRPKRLNVVEGAYSMHPDLAGAYDLSVFLDIDARGQADRILKRNGAEMQRRFLGEWIPLEEMYFEKTGAAKRCTMRLRADGAAFDAPLSEPFPREPLQ